MKYLWKSKRGFEPNVLLNYVNIAAKEHGMEDTELNNIANQVIVEYDIDEKSREKLMKQIEDGEKLAMLEEQPKSEPWNGASNITWPIISHAAINFNARAYPNIVKGRDIVKGKVIGKDENGDKQRRAERVGAHMSYQLKEEMIEWEPDTDKMLISLPIDGTTFKKTYYNPITKRNVSEFCLAKNVCVNMYAKSIENASRVTHIFTLYPNEITERINGGLYREFNYPQSTSNDESDSSDPDAPHIFLEQHRWLDLDGDGYKEPYIVTVHKESRQVCRIVARFEQEGIITNEAGTKIVKIEPIHYFTQFIFIPSMNGTFYGIGWGTLLGTTNDIINTLINQLIDAGTRQNMGGGLISNKLKLVDNVNGEIRYRPGEYPRVINDGEDIRKNIYEFRNQGPSAALFSLLEIIITSSERIANITDVLTGQQPGSNVPATTVVALIEQGLKVFSAVYKRVHRSLAEEYNKLYHLNSLYLDDEAYFNVADDEQAIARQDYETESYDIAPVSDPEEISEVLVLAKAESLKELLGQGLNDMAIYRTILEALRIKNIDEILTVEEQGPTPEEMNETRQLDIEERKVQIDGEKVELERAKLMANFDKVDAEIEHLKADSIRLLADAESKEVGDQLAQYKLQLEALSLEVESQRNKMADNTKVKEGQTSETVKPTKPEPKKKTDQPVLNI